MKTIHLLLALVLAAVPTASASMPEDPLPGDCRPFCEGGQEGEDECILPVCPDALLGPDPPGSGCKPTCEESCTDPLCLIGPDPSSCRPYCDLGDQECQDLSCVPILGPPGQGCRPMCLTEAQPECDLFCALGFPAGPPGPGCRPNCAQNDAPRRIAAEAGEVAYALLA